MNFIFFSVKYQVFEGSYLHFVNKLANAPEKNEHYYFLKSWWRCEKITQYIMSYTWFFENIDDIFLILTSFKPILPQSTLDRNQSYSSIDDIKLQVSFEKKNRIKRLCRSKKKCFYFWTSKIPVTDLIVVSRNMIKVPKNMDL